MSKTCTLTVCLCCLSTFGHAARSQEQGHWRFWTVADGLGESWTHSVTVSSDGRVWTQDGSNTITRLDGYDTYRYSGAPRNLDMGVFLGVLVHGSEEMWALHVSEDRNPVGLQQ